MDMFGGLPYDTFYQSYLAPKTSPQVISEMNQGSGLLPASLQLGAAAVDPKAVEQAKKRYMDEVGNPAIAKLQSDLDAEGRGTSTFGGAELAALRSNHERMSYMAGQDMIDRALERWRQKRASYFSGEGSTVAQNTGGPSLAQMLMEQSRLQSQQGTQSPFFRGGPWTALAEAAPTIVSTLGQVVPRVLFPPKSAPTPPMSSMPSNPMYGQYGPFAQMP